MKGIKSMSKLTKIHHLKKYFPLIIIVLLLILLLRTFEMEIRGALHLPSHIGSINSYSMVEFKKEHGWGITDFHFNKEAQTFTYVVSTGKNNELYLNREFVVEKIPFVDYSLRPEIMNQVSKKEEMFIGVNEVSRSIVNLRGENWGVGTYRAVLNLRENKRQFHWIVIYKVDGLFNVNVVGDKMIEGYKK